MPLQSARRDTFKPYEKCHSTALDAGKLAEELGVKNIILYHTEEKTLATRKKNIPVKRQRTSRVESSFRMTWK